MQKNIHSGYTLRGLLGNKAQQKTVIPRAEKFSMCVLAKSKCRLSHDSLKLQKEQLLREAVRV